MESESTPIAALMPCAILEEGLTGCEMIRLLIFLLTAGSWLWGYTQTLQRFSSHLVINFGQHFSTFLNTVVVPLTPSSFLT